MIKKLAFLALCLIAPFAHASVVVDTTAISGLGTTPTTYSSWTTTIGTGINRLITVQCYQDLTTVTNISSMTFGTSTNTLTVAHRHFINTGSSGRQTEIWYSTTVPTGPQVVTVYSGHSAAQVPCGSISFFNVNLSTPIDVSTGATTAVSTPSVNIVTTVSSDTLVDVIGEGTWGDTDFIANAGQTIGWQQQYPARFTGQAASTKLTAASGTYNMGWTIPAAQSAHSAIAVETSTDSPNLSSLTPDTTGINVGAFTLTVNGDHFVSGSTITWNGVGRTTTFLSSTQLTIVVSTADITSIGTSSVRVLNPDGALTAALTFTITGDVTLVWATDGGYKPTRDDLYGTVHSSITTATRIWDGTTITPFQGRNELNGFALVLENNTVVTSTAVSVGYPVLTGPNGYVISSTPAAVSTLWDWRNRPIEVYLVRYLKIRGLSRILWDSYDEQAVPLRMRATYTLNGVGQGVRTGGWTDRPDHDKYYPDPLIPMEAVTGSTFSVLSSSSQAVWFDIYIPKNAPAGLYTGTINVYESGALSHSVPISMTVYPITLPDTPPAKVWAVVGQSDISHRHHGNGFPSYNGIADVYTQTRIHYYQMLHRFGLNPAADGVQTCGTTLAAHAPCPEYQLGLSGALYAETTGYANAPGVGTPDSMYSIFTYGGWTGTSTWLRTYTSTCQNASAWVQWFQQNSPKTEYWWYIADEPSDLTLTNQYSTWITTCPAPGNLLPSLVTASLGRTPSQAPNVSHIATNQALGRGSNPLLQPSDMENAMKFYTSSSSKTLHYYGGNSPWTGTSTTEDDGVAYRVKIWTQYKKHFDHFFIWEVNYWTNSGGGNGQTNVYNDAHTFGFETVAGNATYGDTGFNALNGDGVLVYPGTDMVVSTESYNADVPFPSWRLMELRRGINDFSLLKMASQYDSKAVDAIVQQIIPKVIWEYGVFDPTDPTYQYGDRSWSTDPNVWELAREKLYKIIVQHTR